MNALLWGTHHVIQTLVIPDVAGDDARPCYRGAIKVRDASTGIEEWDNGPAWDTEQQARNHAMALSILYSPTVPFPQQTERRLDPRLQARHARWA